MHQDFHLFKEDGRESGFINWVALRIFAMHTHNDQKGKNCLQRRRRQVFFMYKCVLLFYSGPAWPLEIDTSVSSEYRNFCETKLATGDQGVSFLHASSPLITPGSALVAPVRDPQSHTHISSFCIGQEVLRAARRNRSSCGRVYLFIKSSPLRLSLFSHNHFSTCTKEKTQRSQQESEE